ncbi:alpha/beta hydrolase [soil metagenome]
MPRVPPLHLERSGDGEGRPVIMLHSSGVSGRQWRRIATAVAARGLRAIVPDLSGHGESASLIEPTPFSFRTDVSHVVTLLEAEGPAHVVGHSYGGLIGLLAALATPERILSLTLVEPVAFGVLDREADADARAELDGIELRWGQAEGDRERWLNAFVDYWGGAGAWIALREEARAEFRRGGWAVREGVRSLIEDTTPASAYRNFAFPVCLIRAEHSPLAARRVVQRLGEVLPRATIVEIPGAGHMSPLTHGGAVNAAILGGIE